jgi:hypothetical protein
MVVFALTGDCESGPQSRHWPFQAPHSESLSNWFHITYHINLLNRSLKENLIKRIGGLLIDNNPAPQRLVPRLYVRNVGSLRQARGVYTKCVVSSRHDFRGAPYFAA